MSFYNGILEPYTHTPGEVGSRGPRGFPGPAGEKGEKGDKGDKGDFFFQAFFSQLLKLRSNCEDLSSI